MFPFVNTYSKLPSRFYQRINPTAVSSPVLLKFNKRLEAELGLKVSEFDTAELTEILSGNKVGEGSEPLAMAYAGHQFGHFVPQLGDGRALLLGELIASDGRLRDLHLKGSGRTAFSRGGDGRAALGPMIREYVISEALAALGIPTTRSLAILKTGESLQRDRVLPGAILARMALSRIRVGTFEYFASRGDVEALRILSDYCIERLYPEFKDSAEAYSLFYEKVIERQADLIAHWMSCGFIHGVMNTDNMSISGESIDFGPCAFMDEYHPRKTFSSIDRQGRYAYEQQPYVGAWNLDILGHCLRPLFSLNPAEAEIRHQESHSRFREQYHRQWLLKMAKKLGVGDGSLFTSRIESLLKDYLEILAKHQVDYTLGFADLSFQLQQALEENPSLKGALGGDRSFLEGAKLPDSIRKAGRLVMESDPQALRPWRKTWLSILEEQADPLKVVIERLANSNPLVIPRNHQVERVIALAEQEGDLGPMDELVEALQDPFSASHWGSEWMKPPTEGERVLQTFCGT